MHDRQKHQCEDCRALKRLGMSQAQPVPSNDEAQAQPVPSNDEAHPQPIPSNNEAQDIVRVSMLYPMCKHFRMRENCLDCKVKYLCPHGKVKYFCGDCGGSQFCPHKKAAKSCCAQCSSHLFCPHGRRTHAYCWQCSAPPDDDANDGGAGPSTSEPRPKKRRKQ
jgi:hypothetical protein